MLTHLRFPRVFLKKTTTIGKVCVSKHSAMIPASWFSGGPLQGERRGGPTHVDNLTGVFFLFIFCLFLKKIEE